MRTQQRCGGVALLIPVLGLIATTTGSAQDIAEGGSPLYSIAVEESVRTLRERGDEKSPAGNKVCPNCGKVHPPAEQAHTNHVAAASQQQDKPCSKCGQIHPPQTHVHDAEAVQQAEAKEGYYYCPKCKAYHKHPAAEPAITTTNAAGHVGDDK